jgi:hypothetical protein
LPAKIAPPFANGRPHLQVLGIWPSASAGNHDDLNRRINSIRVPITYPSPARKSTRSEERSSEGCASTRANYQHQYQEYSLAPECSNEFGCQVDLRAEKDYDEYKKNIIKITSCCSSASTFVFILSRPAWKYPAAARNSSGIVV